MVQTKGTPSAGKKAPVKGKPRQASPGRPVKKS